MSLLQVLKMGNKAGTENLSDLLPKLWVGHWVTVVIRNNFLSQPLNTIS